LLVTYATDLSRRAIKCCSVVFGITLKLLVINILSSFRTINKHRRLSCGTVVRRRRIDNTWPVAVLAARTEARYWLRIAISAYPTAFDALVRGFPSEYCYAVWCGKTRMVWLPDSEKISKISLFVLTECTNVTDGHRMTV